MIFTVGCSYWFVHQKKKLKKKFLEIVCSFQFYGGTRLCNVYCHYYFLFHHRDSGFIPNEFLRKSKLYLIWKRLFSLHVDYRGGKRRQRCRQQKEILNHWSEEDFVYAHMMTMQFVVLFAHIENQFKVMSSDYNPISKHIFRSSIITESWDFSRSNRSRNVFRRKNDSLKI